MALRKSVVPTVGALVLGVVAAVFAARWMQNRLADVESSRAGTVPVVVAAIEIPFGERIKATDVKTINWPQMQRPDDSFADPSLVVGRFTNQKLLPGEMVLKQRIVDESAGNLLSTLIEPNHRAVTVRVNDVIGVAGFLLPGNRVDVLATRKDNNRRAETRTLLQNLKVLAVDQTTAQEGKDEPVVVRAVTLEMRPDQAEQLVSATEEGSVQLALRNPEDLSVATSPEPPPPPAEIVAVTPPSTAVKPTTTRKSAPKAVKPAEETVTVIRQAQTSEIEAKQ